MHQNQWLAAIEDLQSEGLEETVVLKAREVRVFISSGITQEVGKPKVVGQKVLQVEESFSMWRILSAGTRTEPPQPDPRLRYGQNTLSQSEQCYG